MDLLNPIANAEETRREAARREAAGASRGTVELLRRRADELDGRLARADEQIVALTRD